MRIPKDGLFNPKNLLMYVGALLLLVIVIIAILAATLLYQNISGNEYNQNTIVVNGTGHVDAVPDIAVISVIFEEEGEEVKTAEETVNKRAGEFVSQTIGLGIEKKNIKTNNYSVRPKYETVPIDSGTKERGWRPTKQEQVGFVVSQNISVKIYDKDLVSGVLDAANDNDPQNVWGPNYTIDDNTDYAEEALEKAIINAKAKAKNRAKILGVSLEKLISYSEGGGYYPGPVVMEARVASFGMDSEENADYKSVVPEGEERITRTVTLEYKIR